MLRVVGWVGEAVTMNQEGRKDVRKLEEVREKKSQSCFLVARLFSSNKKRRLG